MPPSGAVLVTGGAGYVGSHAAKARDERGWLPKRSGLGRIVTDALAFAERGAVA